MKHTQSCHALEPGFKSNYLAHNEFDEVFLMTFKANRAMVTAVALAVLGSCGMVETAVAQNLTIPSDTDVRAFEPPIDVTPGQLVAQGRYGAAGGFYGPSAAGRISQGFVALAPGYAYDDER